MVLAKIQEQASAYHRFIKSQPILEAGYYWETLQNFQLHWNPGASSPAGMYDQCLQNSETRRLWQDGAWQPKRMMMLFWETDPEMLKSMFEDLYNEQHAPENRASRFVFGCEALLSAYKKANPLSIENNHYHDDYKLISQYLAFHLPEQYAVYDFELFRNALTLLGARNIPEGHDFGRFVKASRTLYSFLEKEEGLIDSIQNRLKPHVHYRGKTLLLVTAFMEFLAV